MNLRTRKKYASKLWRNFHLKVLHCCCGSLDNVVRPFLYQCFGLEPFSLRDELFLLNILHPELFNRTRGGSPRRKNRNDDRNHSFLKKLA